MLKPSQPNVLRFLIDANVRKSVGQYLISLGHDVRFLAGTAEHALPDEMVLQLAYQERRIIITNDTDFGDLIFLHHDPSAGVVLFRLTETSARSYTAHLQILLSQYQARLPESFVVVTDQHIRLRPHS